MPFFRSRRRWPWVLAAIVLGLAVLLSSAAFPSWAGAQTAGLPSGPGDPVAIRTPSAATGDLPAACLRGPSAPPVAPPPPALDLGASRRWIRLPILMYHYIEPSAPGLSLVERGLTVEPQDFAAQMRYLHDRGYVTVSLYDLVLALRTGSPLPPRAVVLTFDGGHRSLLRYALPVMQAYGFSGTIFAITKGMDQGQGLYLTWAQARDLYAQGWKIEPHTRTHLGLARRDSALQWSELCGSMLDVAEHIGVMPRFIAYPSGQYDALTLKLVKALGFWGGLTTRSDRWHSLWSENTLARVRVSGTESLQQFTTSVDGDLFLGRAPN